LEVVRMRAGVGRERCGESEGEGGDEGKRVPGKENKTNPLCLTLKVRERVAGVET
jgi:hypothetical protein